MPTTLREQAIVTLAAVRTDMPERVNPKARVCADIRKTFGFEHYTLRELIDAVTWAMEQPPFDPQRYRKPADVGWRFEFPNGHTATVIVDPRRPFRFEVATGGITSGGLTSEQVEAKLAVIASLSAR